MQIEFDPDKRNKTLLERSLDFARAVEVFDCVIVTITDTRYDYGETRLMSVGQLDNRVVIVVWTLRGAARRIISMRYANEREIAKYTF